jgi:hypothetical protein
MPTDYVSIMVRGESLNGIINTKSINQSIKQTNESLIVNKQLGETAQQIFTTRAQAHKGKKESATPPLWSRLVPWMRYGSTIVDNVGQARH